MYRQNTSIKLLMISGKYLVIMYLFGNIVRSVASARQTGENLSKKRTNERK